MALTEQQESVLEEIIDAYENGKRLSDLPESTNTNPQELLVEVLDNGESKKARLADLLPYSEEDTSYGIQRSIYDSSPTCTRIGNMDLHKTLPVQSLMRGCLLDDDGNVVEYLPDDSWEGATLDGSKGQVMVEIPLHYRKCKLYDDGTMEVRLSLYPLADYEQIPKFYISAYEAAVQRSTTTLCSVKNSDPDYRGGNNNADYDDTDHSLLGLPATSLSLTNFRNYARKRGSVGKNGCGWNCYPYFQRKAIVWLYVVEYANLNIQADYNAELTEEGYHQGGLGDCAATAQYNQMSAWNGNNPFVPCGYTDSIGNRTGITTFTLPDTFEGSEKELHPARYRGIENPVGHRDCWFDGVLSFRKEGDVDRSFYVCDDPAKFSSTSVEDYTFVGTGLANGDSFIKEIIFGAGGEILPHECGGSATTYYCDIGQMSASEATEDQLYGVRSFMVGYNANYCGLFSFSDLNAPSSARSALGSRLCFIPA